MCCRPCFSSAVYGVLGTVGKLTSCWMHHLVLDSGVWGELARQVVGPEVAGRLAGWNATWYWHEAATKPSRNASQRHQSPSNHLMGGEHQGGISWQNSWLVA